MRAILCIVTLALMGCGDEIAPPAGPAEAKSYCCTPSLWECSLVRADMNPDAVCKRCECVTCDLRLVQHTSCFLRACSPPPCQAPLCGRETLKVGEEKTITEHEACL